MKPFEAVSLLSTVAKKLGCPKGHPSFLIVGDSNNSMQMSGGHLLGGGLTTPTPWCNESPLSHPEPFVCWRVPPISSASRRNVDQIGICTMPKSVGTMHFFKKSYKNTRTNNSRYPFGYLTDRRETPVLCQAKLGFESILDKI